MEARYLWRWRVILPSEVELPRAQQRSLPWKYETSEPTRIMGQSAEDLAPGARIEIEVYQRVGRTVIEG